MCQTPHETLQKARQKEEEEQETRTERAGIGRIKKEPVNLNNFTSDITFRSSTVFGYTEPGAGKKKFECQDTYCIIDLPEDHLKYYAVYDGHGNVGRSVRFLYFTIIRHLF